MNKFIKFPLVLGLVGTICAGALSVVYEITKERIQYNANKEAYDLLGSIVPSMDSVESVVDTFDEDKLSAAKISNVYAITEGNEVTAYGYQAEVNGYQPGIKFVLVLSATEEVIIGFDVVSHNETKGGTYGGPLLDSPDFAAQFKDLAFDEVASEVDYVAGSTAKVTLSAVLTGVDNVISFHKEEIFGAEGSSISLTSAELAMLAIPEGQTLVDKTEDFKTALKGKVSENMYEKTMESLGLLNYVDIVDANNAVKGHAYIVEGSYSCEVMHGQRATQTYKLVFQVDENDANTKVTVVNSTDSMGAIGLPSISEHSWLSESFNGFTLAELNTSLSNDGVDKITGATFTSNAIIAHMSAIVNAHSRAYGA